MSKIDFPYRVQKGDTLGKIVDDSEKDIKKKGLRNDIYVGDIIEYKKGKLTIDGENAYKKSIINRDSLSKIVGAETYEIIKGKVLYNVIGSTNRNKFKSVLWKFKEIQLPGDKVIIKGNTISLNRGSKVIHSESVNGNPKFINHTVLNDNETLDKYKGIINEHINNRKIMNEIAHELSHIPRKKIKELKSKTYRKRDGTLSNRYEDYLRLAKAAKRGNKNVLFGFGIGDKYRENIKGTFIAKGVINRTDGKKELPKHASPNSFRVVKRKDGYVMLGYYGSTGRLEMGTFTTPGGFQKDKNTKKIRLHKSPSNTLIENIPISLDKFHLSDSYSDALMPYSVRITNSGILVHYGKTTGKKGSHGCYRIPLFYVKGLFDKIGKLNRRTNKLSLKADRLY